MKDYELFVVREDGQVEVNWDSLLMVTNENFVYEIQSLVTDCGEKIKKIYHLPNGVTQVFTRSGHSLVGIYEFRSSTQTWTYNYYGKNCLLDMLDCFKEGDK